MDAVINDGEIITDDADDAVDAKHYSITSYGADFDVEGLVRRLDRGHIEIPKFQRAFVWTPRQCSRFIESLLIGLPVPGIFLYRDKGESKLRVIDGQQRLLTLKYFCEGRFKETGREFQLVGVQDEFEGHTFESLPEEDKRRFNDAIIHSSVIQQEAPDDDGSSQFAIFERLNTTSTRLSPQEIRAAIFQGQFNDLLMELNECADWRTLVGKPNRRKRDQELILRFLALYYDADNYKPPRNDFLNSHMRRNRDLVLHPEYDIRCLFESTVSTILNHFDSDAFRPDRAVNAAMTEALMVAIARRLQSSPIVRSMRREYDTLLANEDFRESIASGTSQRQNVRTRLRLATEAFALVE